MPEKRMVDGTAGYSEAAKRFFTIAESIRFTDVHHAILHLVPTSPARILDIGAGSGRDAAAFAAMGHDVVAVEPVAKLRCMAAAAHPSPRIEWLDGYLPELSCLARRRDCFDLVMLSAVWMHLDELQRKQAMGTVARLVCEGGIVIMSLRHGPVPIGRRMFDVSAEETEALASREGLRLTLKLEHQPSAFARMDVIWTRLAFIKHKTPQ